MLHYTYISYLAIYNSYRGSPRSIPRQSIWDIQSTKWHWDRYFEYFDFGGPRSIPRQSIWDIQSTKWHWDRYFEYFGFWGPRSIPRQSIWDIQSTKWHWDRYFEYFGFPLLILSHHCSIFIFINTLLLPEGQTGESWEPSKKGCSVVNREALGRKELSLVCVVNKVFPHIHAPSVISP